jgi:hypothetical protein
MQIISLAYAAISEKATVKLAWLLRKGTYKEPACNSDAHGVQWALYLRRRVDITPRRRPKNDCALTLNAQNHPNIRRRRSRSLHEVALTGHCRIGLYAAVARPFSGGTRQSKSEINQSSCCASQRGFQIRSFVHGKRADGRIKDVSFHNPLSQRLSKARGIRTTPRGIALGISLTGKLAVARFGRD